MFTRKVLIVAAGGFVALLPLARAEVAPVVVPPKAPVATPAPAPRPQFSGVSIRVEQPSKSTSEKDKKTVERSLKIFVSNNSNAPLELKVKYIMFGHDAASKDIKALDEGERAASVKSRATETVETAATTAVTTEGKFDNKTHKTTPPTGEKFLGYGVQVFNGEQLVAESYDPSSLKESWGRVVGTRKAK